MAIVPMFDRTFWVKLVPVVGDKNEPRPEEEPPFFDIDHERIPLAPLAAELIPCPGPGPVLRPSRAFDVGQSAERIHAVLYSERDAGRAMLIREKANPRALSFTPIDLDKKVDLAK